MNILSFYVLYLYSNSLACSMFLVESVGQCVGMQLEENS